MDYRARTKKWRISVIIALLVSLGVCISGVVAAGCEDELPSIVPSILFALLVPCMLSVGIFFIPILRIKKQVNEIIFIEFGTPESKTKTYEILFDGLSFGGREYIEKTSTGAFCINIERGIGRRASHSNQLQKMIFSPDVFVADRYGKRGMAIFKWRDVRRIVAEPGKKLIRIHTKILIDPTDAPSSGILPSSIVTQAALPYRKNIVYLLKTFCAAKIENLPEDMR